MAGVVGSQTGVLNAVGFEDHAEVIMLSHSFQENLTKHQHATATLRPYNTVCYPCHRQHYGSAFCHLEETTGAALCAFDIAPGEVYEAIHEAYRRWKNL